MIGAAAGRFGQGGLSLPVKILLLALGNLLLLAVAAACYFRLQVETGAEAMLLGPASDKMLAIVGRTMRELESTPEERWEGLLGALGREYGARVFLTDTRGNRIAGPRELLPAAVRSRFRYDRARGAPPPPLGGDGPPVFEPPPTPGYDGPAPLGPPPFGRQGPPPPFPPGRFPGMLGHPPPGPPPPVFLVITADPTRYWVGGRLRVPGERAGGMLVLESSSMFNPALFFDLRLIAMVALGAAALSLAFWFPFVRRLTRSIRHMGEATERIAEGRFDVQVDTSRGDELGHLGGEINRMATRLAMLVNGQKRFLGDIAHELSAPIARMQFALGILEQRIDDRDRDAVGDLREEVEQISELVNELLHFSKAALRPGVVRLEPVRVADVVRRVVARESGAAAGEARGGPRIEVNVEPRLQALANELCVSRSLANLLRNAIRYAGHAGPVVLCAHREAEQVVITVADSGPGVEEAELERILEPFYRPEEARTRQTGGAGLGLAIVKSGIESCHGTVVCRNRAPHGLEVTIRLPAVV